MRDELDPIQRVELALIRAEYQNRFQMQIAFIKEKVGKGVVYRNHIARAVASDTGVYYELHDLPEQFSGAVTERYERLFVTPEEALEQLERIYEATKKVTPDNTQRFSLLILYSKQGLVDRKSLYAFDFRVQDDYTLPELLEIGRFQPGVLPPFYKVKLNADYAHEVLGINSGLIFCLTNAGDRHLLVRIPTDGEPITDLSEQPEPTTIQ